MSTFSERLELALTAKGCSRTDLARVLRSSKGTIGVSAAAVSALLSGDSKSMTAENAARAAKLLGCDLYWLCTGEGSMLSAAAPTGLLTDELLRALADADPARQRQAENAARNVLELEPLPRVGNTALAA